MTLADGKFCEEHDPKQAMNFRPKGFVIPDTEAERIGLKAYLDATGWGEVADEPKADATPPPEAKAVAQAETEDKAMAEPAATVQAGEEAPEEKSELEPGLHLDASARRIGRGR